MGTSAMAGDSTYSGKSMQAETMASSKLLFYCKTGESRSLASLGMTIEGESAWLEETVAGSAMSARPDSDQRLDVFWRPRAGSHGKRVDQAGVNDSVWRGQEERPASPIRVGVDARRALPGACGRARFLREMRARPAGSSGGRDGRESRGFPAVPASAVRGWT